jgi:tRNA pseudouridine13 synthase
MDDYTFNYSNLSRVYGANFKGSIKNKANDFVVIELLEPNLAVNQIDVYRDNYKDYKKNNVDKSMIFLLKLNNWDQFKAISFIAKKLNIARSQIGFCGTKDKMAITYQLISIDGFRGNINDVKNINLKDMELTYLGVGEKLFLGKHYGNRFEIKVKVEQLSEIRKYFSNLDKDELYFANYFGLQRFGTYRPISHVVGKYLVKGDVKSAVLSYICNVDTESDELIKKARLIAQSGDYKKAIELFSDMFFYERAMLEYLINNEDDYFGAFNVFPKTMKLMFVHAYQSDLFNRVLSKIIEKKDYDFDMEIPLFGYGLKLIKDRRIRETMQEVLREEDLDLTDFRVPIMPFLSSKGGLRKAFLKPENFSFHIDSDEDCVFLKFDLIKGCYATVFLSEFFNFV